MMHWIAIILILLVLVAGCSDVDSETKPIFKKTVFENSSTQKEINICIDQGGIPIRST